MQLAPPDGSWAQRDKAWDVVMADLYPTMRDALAQRVVLDFPQLHQDLDAWQAFLAEERDLKERQLTFAHGLLWCAEYLAYDPPDALGCAVFDCTGLPRSAPPPYLQGYEGWLRDCLGLLHPSSHRQLRKQWTLDIHFAVAEALQETGDLYVLRLEVLRPGHGHVFPHPAYTCQTKIDTLFTTAMQDAWDAARQLATPGNSAAQYDGRWQVRQLDGHHVLELRGPSVGGAAALGWYHALRKTHPDSALLVMAAIAPNGTLTAVGGIPGKVAAVVADGRFDTLVVADDSNHAEATEAVRKAKKFWPIRVKNLVARRHSPEQSVSLHHLLTIQSRRKRRHLLYAWCSVAVCAILTSCWLWSFVSMRYGNNFLHYGNFPNAARAYHTVLGTPWSPLLPWQRQEAVAGLALAQGYQACAQQAWEQATQAFSTLYSQGTPLWHSYGAVGLAAVAVARGDTQQARILLQQAERDDAAHVLSESVYGDLFFHEGNFEEAMRNYTSAARKTAGFAWQHMHARQGLLLVQGYRDLLRDDWSQAEGIFQELLYSPTSAQWRSYGYAGLAAIAVARGDVQHARVLMQHADRYDATNIFSALVWGHIFLQDGEFQKARQKYETATLTPTSFPWQRAIALSRLGGLEAAEGYVAVALGLYTQAIHAYDQAISLKHQQAAVYANQAYLLEEQSWVVASRQRADKAKELFQQAKNGYEAALRLNPEDAFVQTLLEGMHWRYQSAHERVLVEYYLLALPQCRTSPGGRGIGSLPAFTLAMHTFERQGSFVPRAGEGDVVVHRIREQLQHRSEIEIHESAFEQGCLAVCFLLEGHIAPAQTKTFRTGELSLSIRETTTNTRRIVTTVTWPSGRLDGVVDAAVDDLLRHLHQIYPAGCDATEDVRQMP